MHQQVTDVIAPTSENGHADSGIPLWLKIAWTAWLLVWAPVYWRQYGAQNFLYFCDLGNFLIVLGLWAESRLIFSWQAVGLLVFQTFYSIDLLGAFLFGKHMILLWAVRRLGYDRSAWKWQTLTTCVLVPVNYSWRPEYNVNWARGIGHEQHVMPGWLYLVGYLVVAPLFVYWPTHWALRAWNQRRSVSY